MKAAPSEFRVLDVAVVVRNLMTNSELKPSIQPPGTAPTEGFKCKGSGSRLVIVRYFGPKEKEEHRLNQYADVLQRRGFIIERMGEGAVHPRNEREYKEQRERLGRKVLFVRKRKDQQWVSKIPVQRTRAS